MGDISVNTLRDHKTVGERNVVIKKDIDDSELPKKMVNDVYDSSGNDNQNSDTMNVIKLEPEEVFKENVVAFPFADTIHNPDEHPVKIDTSFIKSELILEDDTEHCENEKILRKRRKSDELDEISENDEATNAKSPKVLKSKDMCLKITDVKSIIPNEKATEQCEKEQLTLMKKESIVAKLGWDPEMMILAVNAVISNNMSSSRASKVFQIPKNTLLKYINEKKTSRRRAKSNMPKPLTKGLSPERESELIHYLLYIQERFYRITRDEIKSIICQFIKLKGISSVFPPNGQPTWSWINALIKQYPSIVPQDSRFKRKNNSISKFSKLLEQEVEENQFSLSMIFNVDETAFSIVHTKDPQFRLMKREDQVLRAKKESFLTVITCMGAARNFIPPMFIFPRRKLTTDLKKALPPGAIASCHPSGWVQMDLFTQWFRHFLRTVKPSKKNPALLIVNSYQSHTKNFEFLKLAHDNHVSIISLPMLCMYKIDFIYKSFMDPLENLYDAEVSLWMNQNLRPLSLHVILEIFSKVYVKYLESEVDAPGFFDKNIDSNGFSEDPAKLVGKKLENFRVKQFLAYMKSQFSTLEEMNSVKDVLHSTLGDMPDPTSSVNTVSTGNSSKLSQFSEDEEDLDEEYSVENVKLESKQHCMFCKESKVEDCKNEKWVKCASCGSLSHNECAGYDGGVYTCDYCKMN